MAGSTSLRSICRTHGVTLQAFQTSQRHVFYKVATTDPYLSIASQPESITTGLAAALELNAASDGQRQLREALLGRLKGHVLEVGTGTGAVAREVAKMEAVQAVTGIDPSPAFLERARSLGGPKEKYVEAYSTDLSSAVETASVDHALMWTTLGHIPEEQHAPTIIELHRVLKPNGVLHILDNDPCSWDFRMHPHDPLNAPVQAMLDSVVQDRFLMRKARALVESNGFVAQPLRIETQLDTSAASYGYRHVLLRAIEEFAASGIVGAPFIEAMKFEAKRRVRVGEFQMALSYAYIEATKAPSK